MEGLKPDAMAQFVVFLSTDEASNINGKIFTVTSDYIGMYPDPEPVKSVYKDGGWNLDDLLEIIPRSLSLGLVNEWTKSPPK